jgi:hypothetical protein
MLHEALTVISNIAVAVGLPVMLLALAISAVLVMAGWGRRQDLLQRQGRPIVTDRVELGQTPFAAGVLDVAAETAALLGRFESLAAQRFVALELAVQPDLAVRTDPRALREVLGDIVGQAIVDASCGRVLLAAARIGGRVQITVSDDGVRADRALRSSQLRPAERLAALQGATMEVDARAGCGTTVVLRLPEAATSRRPGGESETLDPASVWAPARRARANSSVGH